MNRKISTSFERQAYLQSYKSFVPSLINHRFEWEDKQINILLEQASLSIGKLSATIESCDDSSVLSHYLMLREVISSNKIEGIDYSFVDYFLHSDQANKKVDINWLETHNYMKSIQWGADELKKFPLSLRMIKHTHRILYANQPYKHDLAGKMRTQVEPSDMNSDYIPPNRVELKRLINDARRFWTNNDLELPHLIKMAITLFQFENMLPFVDGNGRTARTLMILMLLSLDYLSLPVLTLSVVFNQNRIEYYNRLNQVRARNDIEQWIRFFLNVIIDTEKENSELVRKFQVIKREYSSIIDREISIKRRKSAKRLFEQILRKPLITVSEASSHLDISFQATNLLIRELERVGVLSVRKGARRNRIFEFRPLIELFSLA